MLAASGLNAGLVHRRSEQSPLWA